jgi:RNA polymerase sigma factor (sigma-70 family)
MNYTTDHYEQDKRIALYIFNQNFKGHYLKDDLIQVAVIELWKLRKKQNFKDYVNCACKTALNTMIDFLRKESRHYAESIFNRVSGENDLRLIDILAIEQPTALERCEYMEFVEKLLPLAEHLSKRDRQIVALYLKHYSQTETAERAGVSQQYVSKVIKKFRKSVKLVLDD